MKEHRIDWDPQVLPKEAEAKRIVSDLLANVPLGSYSIAQEPDFTGIICEVDEKGNSRRYVELLIPLRSYLND